ncbi:hypothetical protein K0H32_07985 [Bacteroides fragilis]|nr:hypothetical protein [Bacteroides fragilis]
MMFATFQLNPTSLQQIENIFQGMTTHPMYAQYNIEKSDYDYSSGSIYITIHLYGNPINRFSFYGGKRGKIGSIAIYGANLDGHLRNIRSSMKIFGLEVEDVEYDNQELSPYIDVTLL